jgi:hypothetical protein
MSKQFLKIHDEYYFFDEETGRLYKVIFDRKNVNTAIYMEALKILAEKGADQKGDV